MRYKDLIEEPIYTEERFKSIMDTISRECSIICDAIKKNHTFFYRGTNSPKEESFIMDDIFVSASRTDRKPRDSNHVEHDFCNHGLTLLGYKVNRSNSIAVTSDAHQCQTYGKVYMIFPKNGFHYAHCNRKDMMSFVDSDGHIRHFTKTKYKELYNSLGNTLTTANDVAMFLNTLQDNKYNDFVKSFWQYKIEIYEYVEDTNLDKAITDGNEVMISGEYYAISRLWMDEVLNYFFNKGKNNEI